MNAQAASPQNTKPGLSATALKTIAIAAMLIDHVAWAFVPTASPLGIAMHFVGRITGPTMFFFVAEGYHRTRNVNRYTARLAVFALLSYLPFFYFQHGALPSAQTYAPVGVLYTLFLGLVALRARHEAKTPLAGTLLILACVLFSAIGDWGIIGVILILVFDAWRGSWKKQALAAGAVFLLFLLPDLILGFLWAVPNATAIGVIQLGQFVPLLLLRFYGGQRGRAGPAFSKWFFYLFYPLHLLALGVLQYGGLA